MIDLQPLAQPVGREVSSGIPRQRQGFGDGGAEQRVAKRIQYQGQCAFGDVMVLVADGEFPDQPADRFEDRVQCIAIARQDHPGRERSGALLAKRVEGLVDDVARVGLAPARSLDGFGNAARHPFRNRSGELGLEPGGGSEMVQEIGMRSADFRRDGLQSYRLWTLGKQQPPRGFQRDGPALFGVQAFTDC